MNPDSTQSALIDRENQVIDYLFSGDIAHGSKVIERGLAKDMGFSRIPVREVMARLIARGVLIKDNDNRSVRMRSYSNAEILDLFELREALEVAGARMACQRATQVDLLQMEVICYRMEAEIGNFQSSQWPELDRHFHETMIAASHNSRLVDSFGSLIRECHYVFYRHPLLWGHPFGKEAKSASGPAKDVENPEVRKRLTASMQGVAEEHRKLLNYIREKKADEVQGFIHSRLQDLAHSLVEVSKGAGKSLPIRKPSQSPQENIPFPQKQPAPQL